MTAAGPGTRASPTPTTAPPPHCCGQLTTTSRGHRSQPNEVEQRPLSDYDAAFGLADGLTRRSRDGRQDPPPRPRDLTSEIAFLTRALKAPTLRDAVDRLAQRARSESWTHEEFLVACLQREVSARESHGGEGRIRAARFPARKSWRTSTSTTPAD